MAWRHVWSFFARDTFGVCSTTNLRGKLKSITLLSLQYSSRLLKPPKTSRRLTVRGHGSVHNLGDPE